MAFLNTLKNLFLLGVTAIAILVILKNIQGKAFSTAVPTTTVPIQKTECGATGAPCVINGRHYNVLLPEGEGLFPVFLFFHGSGGSGDIIVTRSTIVNPALARGYAVIAPTALGVNYSNAPRGTGWIANGRRGTRDDYRFTRNVISDAESRFPIDTTRILTAGHSNGATYVWYMSCAAMDFRLSAFAPIGGTLHKGVFAPCDDMRPRYSLMHTHGTSDTIMPHTGRPNGIKPTGRLGALGSIERLTDAAKCQDNATSAIGIFKTTEWSRCLTQNKFGLALYDGGHAIPRGWTDFILDWFEGLE